MTNTVRYPFGKANIQTLSYATTIAAELNNSETILNIAQLAGAVTLNLTINSEMEPGSNLTIKVSVDGTNRTLNPGTGMSGAAQTLTANKSYALSFKYTGSTFTHTGTQILN